MIDIEPKFSGIVVTCNDVARLKECLESLSFCDQLVVVDLFSTDGSDLVAKACGAEIYHHERVPVVELVREVAFSYARNSWIIHIDPDEIFPKERIFDIQHCINSQDIAVIRLPIRFYFRGKPLKGTVWGGENSRQCVYNIDRIVFSKEVHTPTQPKNGLREVRLYNSQEGAIVHYWVDSFAQMFEKHLRYLKREGEAKYIAGERFSWFRWGSQTIEAFKLSLITHKGWLDGVTGIFLSIFFSWYVSMSYISLLKFQRSLKKKM